MDRSWMNARRFSSVYVQGVESFVKENMGQECDIKCPCTHCLNSYIESQKEVQDHLLIRGIDTEYTRWIYHGERSNYRVSANEYDNECDDDVNEDYNHTTGLGGLLGDLVNFYDNASNDNHESRDVPMTFVELLNKAERELYPGCSEFSTLSFIVHLLHLKVFNKWSNKSFDMTLTLLKKALPHGGTLKVVL